MKICPRCQQLFEDTGPKYCPTDEARLIAKHDYDRAEGDPMLSRVIAGRFTIVGLIGEGGMGTVYKAVQSEIERLVALKVLNQELAGSEMPVKRFRREARAASLLSSAHTVRLYEFGQDEDGTLFLAMELLEGESLAERITRVGALHWKKALEVGAQVAESLMEAHDNGVVHRDLKPENVFLAEAPGGKELAKVLDFGLARLTQTEEGPEVGLTHTGMIFGTPGYMSPEQAKGQKVDGRSDVYSLGVVLYELVAGVLPFDSEEAVLLMGQHISADVPTFAQRVPEIEVPAAVENLIRHMLVKNPDERVQTAYEISDEIGDLLRGELEAPRESVDVMGRRTIPEFPEELEREAPRRGPSLMAILGGAVVIAGAIVGAAFAVPGLMGPPPPAPVPAAAVDAAGTAPGTNATKNADAGPREVEIVVAATPKQARVLVDGKAVEGNPYRGSHLKSSEEHRIVIEATGFSSQVIEVPFDSPRQFHVQLTPLPAKRPVKRPGKVRPAKNGGSTKTKGSGLIEKAPY